MITKAIIPIAWIGTRFLPITKAISKEMLPIIDKPVIHFIVEEAVKSGILEIIFVINRNNILIKNYFSENLSLYNSLKEKGKTEMLAELKYLDTIAKINFVYQDEPLGDGHAILCAKDFINNWEDFAVLFGDDIIYNDQPALSQLIKTYKNTNTNIIGTQIIEWKAIENYWTVEIGLENEDFIDVKNLVEKPKMEDAPSNIWIIWKYICKYEIFDAIKNWTKSDDWELRLIDGFKYLLNKWEKISAKIIKWKRFDTGSKQGLLEANIFFWEKM